MLITQPKKSVSLHVAMDLLDLVIGERIGYGAYREVFEYALNPEWVIKIARSDEGIHHNILEFKFYQNLDEQERKHFATIEWMSPGGNAIIQQRVDPIPLQVDLELELPDVWDIKRENMGYVKGVPVIVDLGLTQFEKYSLKKMKFLAGNQRPELPARPKAKRKK